MFGGVKGDDLIQKSFMQAGHFPFRHSRESGNKWFQHFKIGSFTSHIWPRFREGDGVLGKMEVPIGQLSLGSIAIEP